MNRFQLHALKVFFDNSPVTVESFGEFLYPNNRKRVREDAARILLARFTEDGYASQVGEQYGVNEKAAKEALKNYKPEAEEVKKND